MTKEDIEKSGLEIIKATQLQEYERELKIPSNCIDRVRPSHRKVFLLGSIPTLVSDLLG